METLKVIEALTRGREQDRRTGHASHGERSTTAGVTVELRQDNTGETHTIAERGRRLDGILTDHRVEHEHDFVRLNGITDRDSLSHHFFVDTQTTRGIDDDHVNAVLNRVVQTRACDLHRITNAVTGFGCPHLNTSTLTHNLQLVHCIRALKVRGNKKNGLAFFAEPLTELSGKRRLTGTLQTSKHEDRRTMIGKLQFTRFAA